MSTRVTDPPSTSPTSPVEGENNSFQTPEHAQQQPSVLLPSPRPPPSRPNQTTNPQSQSNPKSPTSQNPAAKFRRASTFSHNLPQLSERESIWSTHYLPSEATPQPLDSTPSTGGKNDLAQVLQDVPTIAAHSWSPTGVPRKKLGHLNLGPMQSVLTQRLNALDLKDAMPAENSRLEGTKVTAGGDQRPHKSQSESGMTHYEGRGSEASDALPEGAQHGARKAEEASNRSTRDVGREGLSGGDDNRTTEPWQAVGSAGQKRRPSRSASRGRTHVEKSIEATLASTELSKNVRSRKSSHYMGLFKDNATSPERGKKEEKLKERSESGLQAVENINDLRPTSASPTRLEFATKLGWPTDDLKRALSPTHQHTFEASAAPSLSLSDSYNNVPQPATPARLDPEKEADEATSIASDRPAIPADLLEEIRKEHVLSPIRSTTPESSSGPRTSEAHRTVDTTAQSTKVESQAHGEDDEEHISAAVYFPHAGHTQEEIDAFDPAELRATREAKAEEASKRPQRPKLKAESRKSFTEPAIAEHVDISLQSKNEKSVFHGDYQPPADSVDEGGEKLSPIQEGATETVSSASEYETEATDDEAGLPDVETTPTATPVQKGTLSKQRKRITSAPEPKPAVVLQPYSHQVGGHSTVFQFSRQAVCKKLNNRENEFYERVEQRHPDMLRFLPK